jgi:hypothetical protein
MRMVRQKRYGRAQRWPLWRMYELEVEMGSMSRAEALPRAL